MKLFLSLLWGLVIYIKAECEVCTLVNGQCTEETGEGILCAECSYRGYVENGDCVCTRSTFDPSNMCQSIGGNTTTTLVYYNTSYSVCNCSSDFTYGVYNLSTPELVWINNTMVFKYGQPSPPTCDSCFNQWFGPLPETLTPSAKEFGNVACNKYGGPDPNFITTAAPTQSPNNNDNNNNGRVLTVVGSGEWAECGGHGAWDVDLHACVCDNGWMLRHVGYGFNYVPIYICDICTALWGPLTPTQQNYIIDVPYASFCSLPYTPDPIGDGELKECGGHGVYQFGDCLCDDSDQFGHWNLTMYTIMESTIYATADQTYTEELITYSVNTCTDCMFNYTLTSGCLVNSTTEIDI